MVERPAIPAMRSARGYASALRRCSAGLRRPPASARPVVVSKKVVHLVKPGRQRRGALLRTGVGTGIGPLAQAGLDKPLGLAVGARRIGPGAFVFKAGRRDRRTESLAAIGRTVVGHDPLDGNAVPGKPAE